MHLHLTLRKDCPLWELCMQLSVQGHPTTSCDKKHWVPQNLRPAEAAFTPFFNTLECVRLSLSTYSSATHPFDPLQRPFSLMPFHREAQLLARRPHCWTAAVVWRGCCTTLCSFSAQLPRSAFTVRSFQTQFSGEGATVPMLGELLLGYSPSLPIQQVSPSVDSPYVDGFYKDFCLNVCLPSRLGC